MEAKGISNIAPVQKEDGENGSVFVQINEVDHMMSDSHEPEEPPGFSISHNHPKKESEESQASLRHEKTTVEEQQERPSTLLQVKHEHGAGDMENKQNGDSSDEDPDLPPGFG